MRIRQAVAATHPGQKREINEDRVLRLAKVPLFAVADGMGGPGGGDVAATLALDTLKTQLERLDELRGNVWSDRSSQHRLALSEFFGELFEEASRRIFKEAAHVGRAGMGSTLVLATLVRNFAYIAHVGHSRAYLVREGRLIRLTEDHSLAELRFRRGRMTEEEYLKSSDRYVLYQCLGGGSDLDVDVAEVRLTSGDLLLLCSDGLTRALDEATIQAEVDPNDLATTLRRLVGRANEAGGPDNVSAVLVSVEGEADDDPIEALTDVLRQVFLFQELSQPELLLVAPYLEEVAFEKGATVVQDGELADSFYVVLEGALVHTLGKRTIGRWREGEAFGVVSLTGEMKHAGTVKTTRDARLLALTRDRFRELLRNKPDLGGRLALALLDAAGQRIHELTKRLSDIQSLARGE